MKNLSRIVIFRYEERLGTGILVVPTFFLAFL